MMRRVRGGSDGCKMPMYQVYVLRDDGHVMGRIDLFCDGVEHAKECAKALFESKPVELWEGSTRLERFDPTH